MRSSIGTILLLLFVAVPVFGADETRTPAAEPGASTSKDTKAKTEALSAALKGNSSFDITLALGEMSAQERQNLDQSVLFTALASVPPETRRDLLQKEPGLLSSLNESQQRYFRNAGRSSGQESQTVTNNNGASGGPGGQGGQAQASPSPSPSPAATKPTSTAATATDPSKSGGGEDKKEKVEVAQPKDQKENTFLADTLKAQQEEVDISAIAGAIAAISEGVNAKTLAEIAAQAQAGGASQNAILQILQIGKTNLGSAQLAGTNSGVSGAPGSNGYAVAPSDRLVGSLEAPVRAVTAPKKKAQPQFLEQTYARGVAAANQEPASTEGGRVRVFDGGYGGSGGEGAATGNLRNGGGVPSLPAASGHRGAGE